MRQWSSEPQSIRVKNAMLDEVATAGVDIRLIRVDVEGAEQRRFAELAGLSRVTAA